MNTQLFEQNQQLSIAEISSAPVAAPVACSFPIGIGPVGISPVGIGGYCASESASQSSIIETAFADWDADGRDSVVSALGNEIVPVHKAARMSKNKTTLMGIG